jgi:enoyl-CoA hydratase/carnithine racemase
MDSPVDVAIRSSVMYVTMNAVETRNALTDDLVIGVRGALRTAATDSIIRCVVLRSELESVWCAGGDLKAFASADSIVVKHRSAESLMKLFEELSDFPKPSIAAVDGLALAGGMGLAACCDLIVASDRAQFGTPEINVGLYPFMIMAILYRNLPRKFTTEMLMLGGRISVDDCHRLGFVNRVVPAAEFPAKVADLAESVASKSPLILRMGKEAMVRQRDMPQNMALEYLRSQFSIAQSSEDIREGLAAFFEKRSPNWSGR